MLIHTSTCIAWWARLQFGKGRQRAALFLVTLLLVQLFTSVNAASALSTDDSEASSFGLPLDERCTVSVLNRSSQVQPSGEFTAPNVSSDLGLVRARIICSDEVLGLYGGVSGFLEPVPNGAVDVGEILLGPLPPSVASLAATASPGMLEAAGSTAQIAVQATLSDQTTADVTSGAAGTTYGTSNPGVAYVATVIGSEPLDLAKKVEQAKGLKGARLIIALAPCPTGWDYEPEHTVEVGRMAVNTGVWPLKEYADGRVTHTKIPRKRPPVEEYLKLQGRFRHLFEPQRNDALLARMQARVDAYWAAVS